MKLSHKLAEMTPDKRPQDPHMNGTGLRFETLESASCQTRPKSSERSHSD
jgi:hypothetical protein